MKSEYKRLKRDFKDVLLNINPEEMEKIMHKRFYDSLKTLWIDQDLERYQEAEEKIDELVNKMTPAQVIASIDGQVHALFDLLYELRLNMRSMALQQTVTVLCYHWVMKQVLHYLKDYKATGDDDYLSNAISLLYEMELLHKENYWNNEAIGRIEDLLKTYENVEDLTREDKECLGFLRQFIKNFRALKFE